MSPSSPPSPITTTPKRRRRTSLGDFNQLLGLDGVVPLTSGDIPEGSEAVLYLRVSTARQMNTAIDIDEDGNSIATQREVGTKRCRRLNAPIAREFVEPGNSAQSIAKRPVFRELLRYSSHLTRCRCVWCFLGYYPRFCCGGGMSCCIIFTGALE